MVYEVTAMPRRSSDPTTSQSISLTGRASDELEFLTHFLDTSASDVIRRALRVYAGQILCQNPQFWDQAYREIILKSY